MVQFGFQQPKKPANYEHGVLPAVRHDQPNGQDVLAIIYGIDISLTASITAGAPYFQVVRITAYDLVLQSESTDGDLPGPARIIRYWDEENPLSSDGVQPLAVKAGQRVHLFVSVKVPLNTIPPGSFSGSVVIQSQGGSKTVMLQGTYLGVDETSPIGRKWLALGGEQRMGQVLSNEHTAPDGKGIVQEFDNGVLYELPSTSQVFLFSPAIYAKWTSLANAKDALSNPVWNALGLPTEDTFATTEGGQALRFQGGAIVIRASQQAWIVYGPIYVHYTQFGNLVDPANQPFLGLPISDEGPATSTRGRVSSFDSGDIYWDLSIGAHEVHGAIRQHWSELGGVADSFLGFPITDGTGTPDGVGRFNRFEGGVIFWTPSIGAHEVHGAILNRWSELGFERSYLGYPTSDEGNMTLPFPFPPVPGRISSFQYGQLAYATPDGNVVDLPAFVTQSQQVLTPSGTALGGFVTMTLHSNGNFTVQYHMHDSGATGYSFQVHAIFTTLGGLSLASAHSGSVGGTITSGSRDDDHTDSGNNPWIQRHWLDIQSGTLWVTKDYSATGVIGFFQDLAQSVLDLAAGAVGGVIGIVIGIGSEIGQVFGNLGIGGVFGVLAGVVVFAFTGGVALAIVAGVAVGAVANALIDQRPISQSEYDLANNNVFQGSLPSPAQIVLTNLCGLGGRAFTCPGVDGKIYVNLGDGYGDPVNYKTSAYPEKGQLLVHELTHVWQIYHASFLPGFVCKGIVNQANYIVGQDVYIYGPPGTPWGDFNLEAQGAIVDQWYGGIPVVNAPNRTSGKLPPDTNDPYFGYIQNNVWKGQT